MVIFDSFDIVEQPEDCQQKKMLVIRVKCFVDSEPHCPDSQEAAAHGKVNRCMFAVLADFA